MVFSSLARSCVSLGLVALLSACAPNGLTSEEKARVGAVRVVAPVDPAKPELYSDKTSQTAAMVGAQFGLVGGLIGGSIAAANISAGKKRFASVTQPQAAALPPRMRTAIEDHLKKSGKLPLAANQAAHGTVTFRDVLFGVAHAGDQRFHAIVSATVVVGDPAGKEIWRRGVMGAGKADFSFEEAKANGNLYASGLAEACDAFAQSLCDTM